MKPIMHILPSRLMELDENECAFIYAAIDLRIEAEKRQEEKMKHSSK